MAKPLPLAVYGPVTPISPAVRVTGVLSGADVTVLANDGPVGHATAGSAGELWVPLTSQPGVGQNISAVQKNADGTSDPSLATVTVIDVPNPLPVPVIFSDLNTCMVDIWAGALVPGAKVITTIGGAPFGSLRSSFSTNRRRQRHSRPVVERFPRPKSIQSLVVRTGDVMLQNGQTPLRLRVRVGSIGRSQGSREQEKHCNENRILFHGVVANP